VLIAAAFIGGCAKDGGAVLVTCVKASEVVGARILHARPAAPFGHARLA
jgi:hypothetical protein